MASLQQILATHGVPVFPLRAGTKFGFLTNEPDHGATRDPTRIFDYFHGQSLNYGCSGNGRVLFIDVDDRAAWDAFVAEHGPLPRTFTVETPSGGLHLYFDAGLERFGQADLIKGKVNVRGPGGYVVGPGSTAPDKRNPGTLGTYRVVDYGADDGVLIAPLPDSLKARLRLREERAELAGPKVVSDLDTPDAVALARLRLANRPPAIEGESGGQATYKMACAIFDLGLTVDTAFSLMWEVYNPLCVPPWDADELRTKVENAFQYKTGSHGRDNPGHGFEPVPPEVIGAMVCAAEAAKCGEPGLPTAAPYKWSDPAAIPPREWIYGKHLVRKFISCTVAPGGIGKSSLAIVEALSIVTRRGLLLDHAPRPGRVWYWNGEDPYDELQRRIQAACLHYGIKPEEIVGRLFVNSGRNTPLVIAREERSGLVIAEPVIDAIKKTIRENGIDVFVVDPFVASHAVSENDNSKIEAVARKWAEIADECNCAIDLVHHVRKTGGVEITAEDARGASALNNKARSTRTLNAMSKDEASKAGVDVAHHRQYFRIDTGKANLAPPGGANWCKLESVPLGNARMDRPQDSIGVATRWTRPDPFDGLSSDALQKAQLATQGRRWRRDVQAADWVGKPIAEALGLDLENKLDKERIKSAIDKWVAEGAFLESDEHDDNRKTRRFVHLAP